MINHAEALLETTPRPTWEADTPLRRELEGLAADIRSYKINIYDDRLAPKRADAVRERVARVERFLAGRRHESSKRSVRW